MMKFPLSIEQLKDMATMAGFRFEVDADGTERMYRPDGTLAVTARKKTQVESQTEPKDRR
jgi:hypothetical protein